MKVTDYGPRLAPFDNHLRYRENLVGVEVGVDAGAHAEAMIRYLDIRKLTLIDPWPNDYIRGLCEGRFFTERRRVELIRGESARVASRFGEAHFDFIYCDLPQDGPMAQQALADWWPRLKPGGLLGYRNYTTSWPDMKAVIDGFVAKHGLTTHVEVGEIVIVK